MKRFRSKPRMEREPTLPDVTRRIGKPIRYSSAADRAAMEKLRALLRWPDERKAA